MHACQVVSTLAASAGVIVGCLLGMCSLFFMDLDKADRLKRQAELDTLFETLMEDGHKIIGAERCNLWLVTQPDGKRLVSKVHRGKLPSEKDLRRAFDTVDSVSRATIESSDD